MSSSGIAPSGCRAPPCTPRVPELLLEPSDDIRGVPTPINNRTGSGAAPDHVLPSVEILSIADTPAGYAKHLSPTKRPFLGVPARWAPGVAPAVRNRRKTPESEHQDSAEELTPRPPPRGVCATPLALRTHRNPGPRSGTRSSTRATHRAAPPRAQPRAPPPPGRGPPTAPAAAGRCSRSFPSPPGWVIRPLDPFDSFSVKIPSPSSCEWSSTPPRPSSRCRPPWRSPPSARCRGAAQRHREHQRSLLGLSSTGSPNPPRRAAAPICPPGVPPSGTHAPPAAATPLQLRVNRASDPTTRRWRTLRRPPETRPGRVHRWGVGGWYHRSIM